MHFIIDNQESTMFKLTNEQLLEKLKESVKKAYNELDFEMNNKRVWYSKNSGWFQETYYPKYNLIVFLRKLFTGKPEGPQGKIVNKRI